MRREHSVSLKWVLTTAILLCWLIPISTIAIIAGTMLKNSYTTAFQREVDSSMDHAVAQVRMVLSAAFEENKAVSYDGVVRNTYRAYQQNGDAAALYSAVTEYLTQSFSRNEKVKAAFISYWRDKDILPYVIDPNASSYSVLRAYRDDVEPQVLEMMCDVETPICFFLNDNEMYIVRNLLDAHFEPYATVVMQCDTGVLFQSLENLSRVSSLVVTLDENPIRLEPDGSICILETGEESGMNQVCRQLELDGHLISFTAAATGIDLWKEIPGLGISLAVAAALALLLLSAIILLTYRMVTKPIEQLMDATSRIEAGARGYIIEGEPSSAEFQKLFSRFNSMSAELKSQFDRLVLEQVALQQAKIKALQSQINPHFLNNTLEIINWEARLSENDRICEMIEALSTILDATLDRDGRSMIPLREELGFVDGYLYIIQQRLGDAFIVTREIDESLLDEIIPRLILQPIIENAVEHDLTAQHGGRLKIGARAEDGEIIFEVVHDGTMSDEDRDRIRRMLDADAQEGGDTSIRAQVGLRNVIQRLRLLYGDRGRLTVEEAPVGQIVVCIRFPSGAEA